MPNKKFNKLADQYISNTYSITAIVALLIFICLLVFRILLIFSYNGEIGGIDNNFVYSVMRKMAGFDIYPDPGAFPYAVNLYSPLYIEVCSLFGKIFNLNIDQPIYIYRLCRSVSFIADLTTCIVLFKTINEARNVKKEIALPITAIFACILCYLGYTFSRADSLFLLFYSLTIYILLVKEHNTVNILLVAIATTACIFSKQNGIILPLLAAIWLLKTSSLRKSLLYIGAVVLLLVIGIFAYKKTLGHPYFFYHVIDSLRNRIDFSWFYVYIFKRLADSLILLPLYFAACISFIYFRNGSTKERALSMMLLVQLLFSLGTSLKWGASMGYFNESFLLAFVLIAKYISRVAEKTQNNFSKNILAWTLPLVALFATHVCLQGYLFFIQDQKVKRHAYDSQIAARNYLQPKIGDKYILNLGNQNVNFFKTIFYKSAVVPNYDAVSCCTLPDKTFDYSHLLEDLQNGKIGYLLIDKKDTITSIWGISLEHFKKDTIINDHSIYKFQAE